MLHPNVCYTQIVNTESTNSSHLRLIISSRGPSLYLLHEGRSEGTRSSKRVLHLYSSSLNTVKLFSRVSSFPLLCPRTTVMCPGATCQTAASPRGVCINSGALRRGPRRMFDNRSRARANVLDGSSLLK